MRFYYEVFVASRYYHSQKTLTYYSHEKLVPGTIVSFQLKDQTVLGIINETTKAPSFTTKEVTVLDLPPLPKQTLELIKWFKDYYPAPFGFITQLFLPSSLLKVADNKKVEYKTDLPKKLNLPRLTTEQQAVLSSIKDSGTYLLHGRTGSGKTRIYQELAIKTVASGKSAIILTPEISLTSQLSQRFKEIFGEQVVVWHSHLTAKDRRDLWLKVLNSKQPLVVIGARSALFSPLNNLGLIVVDEAHEASYKQEQAPYYQTVRVASKLASLWPAIFVIGSATPSVVDYFMAQQKKTPILTMQKLATSNQKPKTVIEVVDLKDRGLFTRKQHLSDPLLQAIELAMGKKEQALIFMNRRGTARVVLCSNCGWQALCPNCDTPLTYHGDEHLLRCHICGHKEPAVSNCPVCKSSDILFKGLGTKSLIEELQSYFPKAKVRRFDSDNTKSESFERHYEAVLRGEVDILVGTQMLAKGLDLPKLSVVGVINADTSLSIPDYTAQEKTYQLISQVIGRIGRGHIAGQAVIQTYSPNSPTLQSALKQDWQKFYELEIDERQQFKFPPFCHLLKLTCRRASSESAAKAADKLVDLIVKNKFRVQISGPAPAFHEKHANNFEWQLVIKASRRDELLKIIKVLPGDWSYDIDPVNLL